MSEIKTTRKQTQTRQEDWLRKVLSAVMPPEVAAKMACDIVDQFKGIEDTRSLSDLLHDMVEDAGGGLEGFEEIELLVKMEREAMELQAKVSE